MSQINYATRIEEEGYLGEVGQSAWRQAQKDLETYGKRTIPHSTGTFLKLGDLQAVQQRLVAAQKAFDDLLPGAMEQIKAQKLESLTPTQRKAFETPINQLDPLRLADRQIAEERMMVSNAEIAATAPADKKAEAVRMTLRLDSLKGELSRIIAYRQQVNYDYWLVRCESEQSDAAIAARQAVYDGEKELQAGSLEKAKTTFENAFVKWAEIYQQYPLLARDVTALDLVPAIKNYFRTMSQLDLPIPKDFPLRPMLEAQGQNDLLQLIDGKPISKNTQAPPDGTATAPPAGEVPPPK